MVGCAIRLKRKPEWWLNNLLGGKFFGSCVDHKNVGKNEKNVFCIDCNLRICKHCATSSPHCFHRRLQICRYVYRDVVRLQDILKYLDCSKIQTYKVNGEKAIHLNPRPQSKEMVKATNTKKGAVCEACGRHIQDLPNRFCSIACKVQVVVVETSTQDYEFDDDDNKEYTGIKMADEYLSLSDPTEEAGWLSSTLLKPKPKKQLHKRRKGVPHRAPLR